jgi:uncharacterized membrane protein
MTKYLQLFIRILLSILFIGAGFSHFSNLKHDYLAMLPSFIPGGMTVIYFTGILEIIGGIGLQITKSRRYIAIALIVFLIVILPANINAAINKIPFANSPAAPLLPRLLMQLVLISLLYFTCLFKPKNTTSP